MAFPLFLKAYHILEQPVNLFEPDRNTIMDSYYNGLIPFPYWSQVWPAAVALARFLSSHHHYTRDKHVLELAAGLGLPSVVAAQNAASVVASDYAAEAVRAMKLTIEYNSLQNMQVQLLDWYTLPANLSADVLLLSDVNYDATLFTIQEKAIRRFLQQDTVVIISTPQRLIAKEAIMPLVSFCAHQEEMVIVHRGTVVMITVMVLQQG